MVWTSTRPLQSSEAQLEEAQLTRLLPPFLSNCPCANLELSSCKSESLWLFQCLTAWRRWVCNCENVDVFYHWKCPSTSNVLLLCVVLPSVLLQSVASHSVTSKPLTYLSLWILPQYSWYCTHPFTISASFTQKCNTVMICITTFDHK